MGRDTFGRSAVILVLVAAGCTTSAGLSGEDARAAEAAPPGPPPCSGFPAPPADCAAVRYVCPTGAGSGDSAADPGAPPDLLAASADICLLLGAGEYAGLPLSTRGLRAYGVDKARVTVRGATALFGNEYSLPHSGAPIVLSGMTFREGSLTVGFSASVTLEDVDVVGGAGDPVFIGGVETVALRRLSVTGVRLDAQAMSLALAVSDCARVEAGDLTVADNEGIGVGVVDSRLVIDGGRVDDNGYGGMGFICRGVSTCTLGESHIRGLTLRGNAGVGLLVSGATAAFEDLVVAETAANRFTPGDGVIVKESADVVFRRAAVTANHYRGVLLDHSLAVFEDCAVRDNGDRGLWFQNGTAREARDWSIEVRGAATEVCGNGLVGLGVYAASQVRVSGGRFCDTTLKPVYAGAPQTSGDGIALLAGSSSVVLEDLEFAGNRRAQLIVDGVDAAAGVGIVARRCRVEATGGEQYGVVTQAVEDAGRLDVVDGVEVPSSLDVRPDGPLLVSEDPEPIPDWTVGAPVL